jgi:hypothetical protein
MLRKTKIILLIGSVLLIITIAIVLVTRSLKPPVGTLTEPIIPTSQGTILSIGKQASLEVATASKQTLLPNLPIRILGFETSNGLKTDILISSYDNDEPEVVRIEVFGIDYIPDQNDPAKNPDMIAYRDSFKKAISIIKENNVNINDLHISLSNRKYIRDVAEVWIKTLNLLP